MELNDRFNIEIEFSRNGIERDSFTLKPTEFFSREVNDEADSWSVAMTRWQEIFPIDYVEKRGINVSERAFVTLSIIDCLTADVRCVQTKYWKNGECMLDWRRNSRDGAWQCSQVIIVLGDETTGIHTAKLDLGPCNFEVLSHSFRDLFGNEVEFFDTKVPGVVVRNQD